MPDNPAASPQNSSSRASSQPAFWDERYQAHDRLFGTAPDPFLADALSSLPSGASVLDVGGGDGRNTLPLAHEHGFEVTVLDFAPHALDTAAAYASAHGIATTALHADVRTWTPQRRYDAAVVAFVQLLPDERIRLYDQLRAAVRPGGAIIGLWFRDGHGGDAYDRIGPSKPDRYVHEREIREAFAADTVHTCAPVDRTVQQGPVLRGHAALVQVHVERGPDEGQ
ncbi:SAM-dependent methyltransferase [Longimonas halophila]|uniref:SAM-dependent methyltransferase n=1 Tax=Longimonas halophila TaxID=1469170 RepID=A0A2H3NTC1_9BACT|nr:class I SAM-dependent methyltransferase [Longimonas halophila]PEN09476.1 SAM-dependent methyltransferase [Longimonas halophila]